MPFALHGSIESKLTWLSWLSSIKRTGWSKAQWLYLMKCFKYETKLTDVIQPDGCAEPAVPGGAPFNICTLKYTLGNTMKGGIVLPKALTVQQVVTSWPRSWEVTVPTCFAPSLSRVSCVASELWSMQSRRSYIFCQVWTHTVRKPSPHCP